MEHDNADVAAIENLIRDRYFAAMDAVSFEEFAPAFHPDARLAFVADDRVVYMTLPQWQSRLDGIRADGDHYLHRERGDKRIAAVSVRGNIARAEVHMEFSSARYTDYLQLARHQGRWLIVAKTFHVEAP